MGLFSCKKLLIEFLLLQINDTIYVMTIPSKRLFAIALSVLSIVGYGFFVFAAGPFSAGTELDPVCTPYLNNDPLQGVDTDCTVYSLSIGSSVGMATAGSLLFASTNGVLQQDNANLRWDESLKRLIISQGVTIETVDIVNTISVGGSAQVPVISGNYAYVINTGSSSLSIIDVTDPLTADVVNTISVQDNPITPIISGNYAYVPNRNSDTISIIDISDPVNAFVVNHLSVGSDPAMVIISGNYLYIANGNTGDFTIVDITDPTTAAVVNTLTGGSNLQMPVISGNYVYMTDSGTDSIVVIDISNPVTASLVNTIATGISPEEITISGNYLYVSNTGDATVSVADISNPVTASVVATVAVQNNPQQPVISGNYAYVINRSSGTLSIIDITTPATANVVATVPVGSNPQQPIISGNYAYVSSTNGALVSVIDIATPSAASVVATVSVGNGPQQPVISGNYAYVTNQSGASVSIIDITDPSTASIVTTVGTGTSPRIPVIIGSHAYVVNGGSNTVSVIDLSNVSNVLPPSGVVALSVGGTIQSSILSGSGVINLTADNDGNIIPTFSDQSLKSNVSNISGALDKIKSLQGKYYNWKDDVRFGSQREIGFIAQEVEPYVPEVVRTVGSLKTLNYGNLVALHNEGIKELELRLATIESLANINEASATQSLFGRFAEYLQSTTNKIIGGVVRFTNKTIHQEICLGDGIDNTCITKSELDALLLQAGMQGVQNEEIIENQDEVSTEDEALINDENQNQNNQEEPSPVDPSQEPEIISETPQEISS